MRIQTRIDAVNEILNDKNHWEHTSMAYGTDRQMFDVNCSCAKCGAHISQLPFQPSGDRPVYCSDCNRQYRQSNTAGGDNRPRAPRQMFQVDLTCAECGAKITELPFMPNGDKPVYCKACLMAKRSAMN